ncbi:MULTISPECIES: CAP domain-containing protein [unclassified Paracoccus (in: a-proteobacteria)]|uniref:CAP domain-containing protein n=1 Tax=unclassified Paracoccus (in: a-proteobacteria) TaxID=2688777 RepID=UPI0012B33BBB|nr:MULTISPECIES: CAP domain-containing protein [unclassified Paracoccus (in: a-proteobacteria)]UXU75040.1 CAP domain-containing protein [Paracoccus sp. SMMA_5]UXU80943.1 CAP domain-containing protein [Paracoccus sp. SMMA_5_TC]
MKIKLFAGLVLGWVVVAGPGLAESANHFAEYRISATTAAAQVGQVRCVQPDAQANRLAAAATNATRRSHGLPPVSPNATLARAAARHACDMARRGVMSHRGSGTRGPMQRLKAQGYRPRLAAENIAAGPFAQDRVLREWERSRGHLANILIPQLRDYGIGHAIGADGRTIYWAAVYGAPR